MMLVMLLNVPKVVGSIPTVVGHIFQACSVWKNTQSNITSINSIYSFALYENILLALLL
jgi:hypothetical protein